MNQTFCEVCRCDVDISTVTTPTTNVCSFFSPCRFPFSLYSICEFFAFVDSAHSLFWLYFLFHIFFIFFFILYKCPVIKTKTNEILCCLNCFLFLDMNMLTLTSVAISHKAMHRHSRCCNFRK